VGPGSDLEGLREPGAEIGGEHCGKPGFVYCCWRTLDHSFQAVLAGLG